MSGHRSWKEIRDQWAPPSPEVQQMMREYKDAQRRRKNLVSVVLEEGVDAANELLDVYIDNWHDGDSPLPLHHYCGMTVEEWAAWVSDSSDIPISLD